MIRGTWAKATQQIGEDEFTMQEFAAEFYRRLFLIDPSLQSLFRGDMVMQGKKLMSVLNHLIGSVEGLTKEELASTQTLGIHHKFFGVLPQNYTSLENALLQTLKFKLGSEFSEEVENTWKEAIEFLSEIMIEAADMEGVPKEPETESKQKHHKCQVM